MNPCQLTAAITAIANLLAGCLTDDELAVLAAELTQLADTLAVLAAARSFCAGDSVQRCETRTTP